MKIDRYVRHRNGSLLLLLFFVFMSVISFLNENNFMREIFSFLCPVNTMPNKFENASFFHRFWPKTYKSFLSTLIRKKLENAKLPEKSYKMRFMPISVDGRPNRKNEVAFSNLSGIEWTGP